MASVFPHMTSGVEIVPSTFDVAHLGIAPVMVNVPVTTAPVNVLGPWSGLERRRSPRTLRADRPSLPLEPAGNRSLTYRSTKRTFDLLGAAVFIMFLSPLLIAVYVALFITTRGRPIFAQQRVGHCGRFFTMFKFRTMYLDADHRQHEVLNEQNGPVFKNRRDPRITPLGRILRSTSIDELPQLFNVLFGHMSLVGPRPPVLKEVLEYEAWQMRRLQVKPGITCLWQVSGRCEIGFQDWVRMDIWYVEHQNLLTDMKLLLRTPRSVLSRRGAY